MNAIAFYFTSYIIFFRLLESQKRLSPLRGNNLFGDSGP